MAPLVILETRPPARSTLFPYTTLFRSRPPVRPTAPGGGGAERMTASPPSSRCCSRNSRSEEHTSELQSLAYLVCRLLLEKKKCNAYLSFGKLVHSIRSVLTVGCECHPE